eukprot:Nk52_evm25s2496 gene=Nk52_evmTU25s2496
MPRKIGFKIAFCSGADEDSPAVRLEEHNPTNNGWESQRFCTFPQIIVLRLEEDCRIRKVQLLSHQYKIATKIELFIGNLPPGRMGDHNEAEYEKLGYVSLSSNESAGFKARELKSVHVDAVGSFMKLVVHKNHVNEHNLFNQVGLVAINVIGGEYEPEYLSSNIRVAADEPKLYATEFYAAGEDSFARNANSGIWGLVNNKPDSISKHDDISFDISTDPEMAKLIRLLSKKKEDCIVEENYDDAKHFKLVIEILEKAGEELGKLEVKKHRAVVKEDFDTAKILKLQIDDFRAKIYNYVGVRKHEEVSDNNIFPPMEEQSSLPKYPVMEERPLNVQKVPPATLDEKPAYVPPPPPPAEAVDPNDERPLPVKNADQAGAAITPFDTGNPPPVEAEPKNELLQDLDPLNEQKRREMATVIDIFGLVLVTKVCSKQFSFRIDALSEVIEELRHQGTIEFKNKHAVFRATSQIVKLAIHDNVMAVFNMAMDVYKVLIQVYAKKNAVSSSEVHNSVESIMPDLLLKTGDLNARNREGAMDFVQYLGKVNSVGIDFIATVILVHDKKKMAPRQNLGRLELVQRLVKEFKLRKDGQFTLNSVMGYVQHFFDNPNGNVREAAAHLTAEVYKLLGDEVEPFITKVSPKLLEMIRKLFKEHNKKTKLKNTGGKKPVDSVDEKDALVDQLKSQLAELQTLAKEQKKGGKVNLPDWAGGKEKPRRGGRHTADSDSSGMEDGYERRKGRKGKGPQDINININLNTSDQKGTNVAKPRANPPSVNQSLKSPVRAVNAVPKRSRNAASVSSDGVRRNISSSLSMSADFNIEKMCIFCGEKNDTFNDENLDVHYWKDCPMLTSCVYCKQIVEIPLLNEHWLSECDEKTSMRMCPRCREAVHDDDYESHVLRKNCLVAQPPEKANRCPLCHLNIPPGDDGWQTHLMAADNGCQISTRRGKLKGASRAESRIPRLAQSRR